MPPLPPPGSATVKRACVCICLSCPTGNEVRPWKTSSYFCLKENLPRIQGKEQHRKLHSTGITSREVNSDIIINAETVTCPGKVYKILKVNDNNSYWLQQPFSDPYTPIREATLRPR